MKYVASVGMAACMRTMFVPLMNPSAPSSPPLDLYECNMSAADGAVFPIPADVALATLEIATSYVISPSAAVDDTLIPQSAIVRVPLTALSNVM